MSGKSLSRSVVGLVVWLAVAALIAACGSSKERQFDDGTGPNASSGGAAPIATSGTVVVEPTDTVLEVADAKTPSVEYHAFLVGADGARQDVTAAAHFSVDKHGGQTYGTFVTSTFTASPTGVGKTLVRARVGSIDGTANLTLHLTKVIIADGAPPDAASKFTGAADASKKPTVVYPPDGVMVPPNMNEIEWQYQPAAGTDLFELAAKNAALDLKVYFACNALAGGCGYAPAPTVWAILSGAGRGDELATTLRATSKAGGGPVGASAARAIAFGEDDIVGGIYYWNAAAGATMRYEFGVSGQKAETYMNAPKAGAAVCVGCHVLSRDGERISVGLDIPAPSPYKVFDVGAKSLVFGSAASGGPGANFFTFSPDKTQMMVSNGVTLSLRNAATGSAIIETVTQGAMPDWSPDGTSVVFAKSKVSPPCFGAICGSPGVSEASLHTTTKVGSSFSTPGVLVASTGQNNYYPSYSPDGGWVAFNRASVGTDADGKAKSSYDAADATVWVVAANSAGAGTPIALSRATSPNGDSWPKWMQVAQTYKGKKIMWLTFSSRRAYGLRQAAGKNAQIWMVAFDPEAAAQGKDPAFASFWLPFQELASGNHIAQWVTKIVRQGCAESSQCDGSESCVDSVCLPTVR